MTALTFVPARFEFGSFADEQVTFMLIAALYRSIAQPDIAIDESAEWQSQRRARFGDTSSVIARAFSDGFRVPAAGQSSTDLMPGAHHRIRMSPPPHLPAEP